MCVCVSGCVVGGVNGVGRRRREGIVLFDFAFVEVVFMAVCALSVTDVSTPPGSCVVRVMCCEGHV